MAGRPKMTSDLARLAVEPELGPTILGMLAEGRQFTRICAETGLSKRAVLDWLDETPERAELASRARARAAHALVDEAIEIADEADEENAVALQKAKLRTQVRHWTAERWGRQAYGQKTAEVNISITGLHFEALRARSMDHQDVIDVDSRPTDDELASL